MRKTLYVLAIALMVSTVAGIYDPNGTQTDCEPDEPCIMTKTGGAAAIATTSVGSNGTEYSSSVEMRGRTPNVTDGDRVENVSHSENETTFTGYIKTPTPCHVIDQEIEELEDQSYRMNIQTVKDNESQWCAQQVVMIEYDGSFEAEAPYSLEIRHNNETVDTLENTVEGTEEPKKNMFEKLFQWLGHLF